MQGKLHGLPLPLRTKYDIGPQEFFHFARPNFICSFLLYHLKSFSPYGIFAVLVLGQRSLIGICLCNSFFLTMGNVVQSSDLPKLRVQPGIPFSFLIERITLLYHVNIPIQATIVWELLRNDPYLRRPSGIHWTVNVEYRNAALGYFLVLCCDFQSHLRLIGCEVLHFPALQPSSMNCVTCVTFYWVTIPDRICFFWLALYLGLHKLQQSVAC